MGGPKTHNFDSSMKSDILIHENNAIKSIERYLLEGYENRLRCAKSEEIDILPSPITYQLEFWAYVEKAFLRYFSKVDNYYTKLFTPPPRGSKARNIRLGSDLYWYDPIEELKASFEEIEAMYLYNNSHHPRCKQLFSKLTDEIMAAIYTVKKDDVPYILGRVHFNHIDKMLNLADKQIVALLPFLLTAYVYNFRQNKFMSVGTVAVERAFTIDGILEENITSKNDNDTRAQLKQLSTRFGFEKSTINFSDVKTEEKEPSASTIIDEEDTSASVFWPSKYPSLQNKTMMDLVL